MLSSMIVLFNVAENIFVYGSVYFCNFIHVTGGTLYQ